MSHEPAWRAPAGRDEFSELLPPQTACLLIAPIGREGVLLVGGDRQRGFTKLDQAWVADIADKLDDTLAGSSPAGFGSSRSP